MTCGKYPQTGGDSRRSKLAPLTVPDDPGAPGCPWALACQFGLLTAAVSDSGEGRFGLEGNLCMSEIPLPIKTFAIKSVEDGEAKFSFERWH